MLRSHLDRVEESLLSKAGIAKSSGHPVNIGGARESFIRDFLNCHLSTSLSVGSGEIIDCNSRPGESRNQIDVILYRSEYPKLHIAADVCAFLAESVVATIEIKSTLKKSELSKSIDSAGRMKQLTRSYHESISSGWRPPAILNYVVAYDGPATMKTVDNWLGDLHAEKGITTPNLPPTTPARCDVPSPSVDGIFVLGKGFIYFDNVPVGLCTDEIHAKVPDRACKSFCVTPAGNVICFIWAGGPQTGSRSG